MTRPPHNWGTPNWILELHRKIFGPIDLDLASDAVANERVQATKYWTRDEPLDPLRDAHLRESNWCNPPGPWKVSVKLWDAWCTRVIRGAYGSFLFFNANHLRHVSIPAKDLVECPIYLGILRKRVKYVGAPSSCSFPSAIVAATACTYLLDPSVALWSRLCWAQLYLRPRVDCRIVV